MGKRWPERNAAPPIPARPVLRQLRRWQARLGARPSKIRDGAWCADAFCMYVYEDVWTIADVAVAEGCRRTGLGKGLVTACTQYVLAGGGRPTYQAFVDNVASRRTCKALGYVPVGSTFRFELKAP